MKIEKFSQLVSLVSGASVFALGWFFVLGLVKVEFLTLTFFFFFVFIWLVSINWDKKK